MSGQVNVAGSGAEDVDLECTSTIRSTIRRRPGLKELRSELVG